MVNIDIVLSSLIAQAPLVAVAILILYYTLDKKIDKVKIELKGHIDKLEKAVDGLSNRVEKLEASVAELRDRVEKVESSMSELKGRVDSIAARLNALRRDVRTLAKGFYTYQTTLIDFLSAKGVVNEPEAVLLRGSLKTAVPYVQSKYYTEEVRRRLIALLDKEIKDYTWDDVAELERIAEAIYNEYIETGREDLLDYYPKLMTYIAVVRGLIRRREMEKKTQGGAVV